jgi:hypothetical protein
MIDTTTSSSTMVKPFRRTIVMATPFRATDAAIWNGPLARELESAADSADLLAVASDRGLPPLGSAQVRKR